MRTFRKTDVTVLFICFNEELSIAAAIKQFQKSGFTNIVVVDDHSGDATAASSKKAGAEVIRNRSTLGFNYAVLRGLYAVQAKHVLLITDPSSEINAVQLKNFVELGVLGDYPILLPHGKAHHGIVFSKVLKQKYGILLPEPGFESIFLNDHMLNIIQKRVTGISPYVLFEIIKAAADEHAKIGVYNSGIFNTEYPPSGLHYRLRKRKIGTERRNYIRDAFPNLARQQQRNKLITGIIIGGAGAALGVAIVGFVQWLARYGQIIIKF